LKYFVSKGADVNAKGKDGFPPLHVASYYGKLAAAKLLVSKRASVNTKSNDGWTPLDYARDQTEDAMVRYLQSVGAR